MKIHLAECKMEQSTEKLEIKDTEQKLLHFSTLEIMKTRNTRNSIKGKEGMDMKSTKQAGGIIKLGD